MVCMLSYCKSLNYHTTAKRGVQKPEHIKENRKVATSSEKLRNIHGTYPHMHSKAIQNAFFSRYLNILVSKKKGYWLAHWYVHFEATECGSMGLGKNKYILTLNYIHSKSNQNAFCLRCWIYFGQETCWAFPFEWGLVPTKGKGVSLPSFCHYGKNRGIVG